MKHEFYAYYSLKAKASKLHQNGIDILSGDRKTAYKGIEEFQEIYDIFAKIQIMTQSINTKSKNYARIGTHKKMAGLLSIIENKRLNKYFEEQKTVFINRLKLVEPPELINLPSGTWFLKIEFELKSPYYSKDEQVYYIIDNPIRKDWVFKVPYISGSQWKGGLRSAITRNIVDWWNNLENTDNPEIKKTFLEKRIQIARLFGPEKDLDVNYEKMELFLDTIGTDELSRQYRDKIKKIAQGNAIMGRLRFYPTFFSKIRLEVINPHDKITGAGTNPIYLEIVPQGTKGTFSLLYVPFDVIGEDKVDIKKKSQDDFLLVANGLKMLLTEYGIGAKTTSGFGLANNTINGTIICNKTMKKYNKFSELVGAEIDVE